MKDLVERVQKGEEMDGEKVRAVLGVRGYLEKKEDCRVGEWVKEVCFSLSSVLRTCIWGFGLDFV